jgi:hypothetical protein
MTVDDWEHGNTPPGEIIMISETSNQKLLECTLLQEKLKQSGCTQITPKKQKVK